MFGVSAVQNDFGWGIVGVLIGSIVTGFFSWLTQRGKTESDQSVAVLDQWSKLNKGLADRLAAVEKEFSEYRQQVAAEMDDMRRKHRAEMRAMRELNEGLQRMIAQNSQSTAHLISESPVTYPKEEDDAD